MPDVTHEQADADYLSRPDLHGRWMRPKGNPDGERFNFSQGLIERNGGLAALLEAWEPVDE